MDIVQSVHEGLYNAPKLYGSEVREPGKVTGFSSGMKEAGKVFQHQLPIAGRN
jgi:sterol 3beta-glucosyltransferase